MKFNERTIHWKTRIIEGRKKKYGSESIGQIIFKKKNVKNLIYKFILFLDITIFHFDILFSKYYKLLVFIAEKQNRYIDQAMTRHLSTIFTIKNYFGTINIPTVIIGDGRTNMASLLYFIPFINSKIFLINLPEVNIYEIELMSKLIDRKKIGIVNNETCDIFLKRSKSLEDLPNISFVDTDVLDKFEWNSNALYINLASMQEMTKETKKSYFSWMRKNGGYFYQCNRVKKVLMGGESSAFVDYPFLKNDFFFFKRIKRFKDAWFFSVNFPFINRTADQIESLTYIAREG